MPDSLAEQIDVLAREGVQVPYLEQYFGVWAIEEHVFRAGWRRANDNFNVHLHLKSQAPVEAQAASQVRFQRVGNVGMVNLSGTLMKQASSFSDSTSTVMARRQVRAMARDPDVSAILLHVDSPGGTLAGTKDLADDVAAAAEQKPVHAFIEDLGASAAYWVASQATKVFANDTALVGAVGTYGVLYDLSAAAEQQGVVVHVVKAGEFKGLGVEGTEVTEEQLAEVQKQINEVNEHFIRGVAAGRKLKLADVRALADGRVHVGQAAAANRLIDGVQSLDATLEGLQRSKPRSKAMSVENPSVSQELDNQDAEKAASYEQLVAACPGADAEFVCEQLKTKATVNQARDAWVAEQNRRIEASRKEAADAKAQAGKPGVDPVGSEGGVAASSFEGDPVSAWKDLVAANVKALGGAENPTAKQRAVSAARQRGVSLLLAQGGRIGLAGVSPDRPPRLEPPRDRRGQERA